MRDDRDIQRSKPASAPEKGRGPHCGKDRRSATVCPCRHVPTCHGFPAKAFQVSLPAVHLARNPCKSVPCSTSCLPPAAAVHLITGCWGFSVGHVAVFSMKRATISTPAAAVYMYLSENHDVSRMVQLRVSHVWTHLQ